MNNIQIFNNPTFGEIRTVILNGEPWFVGNDIAKALGYAKPQNAISTHCRHALKQGIGVQTGNKADGTPSIQNVEMLIIPEGDMYRLISKSKLKSAEQFEEWVFDEVLPTIRKTGTYGQPQLPQTTGEKIALLAQGYTELGQRVDEVDSKVDDVKAEIESLKLDLPILPIEAETITNAVKSRGIKVMGGKDSNAYRDRSIVNTVYRDIYSQIYRNFGVRSYKAIKRSQTDRVIEVVNKYEPPVILADRIQNANAQQRLDV